jgi:hypothetical protein
MPIPAVIVWLEMLVTVGGMFALFIGAIAAMLWMFNR